MLQHARDAGRRRRGRLEQSDAWRVDPAASRAASSTASNDHAELAASPAARSRTSACPGDRARARLPFYNGPRPSRRRRAARRGASRRRRAGGLGARAAGAGVAAGVARRAGAPCASGLRGPRRRRPPSRRPAPTRCGGATTRAGSSRSQVAPPSSRPTARLACAAAGGRRRRSRGPWPAAAASRRTRALPVRRRARARSCRGSRRPPPRRRSTGATAASSRRSSASPRETRARAARRLALRHRGGARWPWASGGRGPERQGLRRGTLRTRGARAAARRLLKRRRRLGGLLSRLPRDAIRRSRAVRRREREASSTSPAAVLRARRLVARDGAVLGPSPPPAPNRRAGCSWSRSRRSRPLAERSGRRRARLAPAPGSPTRARSPPVAGDISAPCRRSPARIDKPPHAPARGDGARAGGAPEAAALPCAEPMSHRRPAAWVPSQDEATPSRSAVARAGDGALGGSRRSLAGRRRRGELRRRAARRHGPSSVARRVGVSRGDRRRRRAHPALKKPEAARTGSPTRRAWMPFSTDGKSCCPRGIPDGQNKPDGAAIEI